MRKLCLLLPSALLLTSCGGGGGSTVAAAPSACSVEGQVQTVIERMEDIYFWNDIAEQQSKYRGIDAADFTSPNALLDFLRYRPDEFDRNFTFLTTVEEDTRFFADGIFAGFGFSFTVLPGNDVRITQVFGGSPAEAAGFVRGYRILEIDGRTIEDIEANEGLDAAFGPATPGITRTFLLEDPNSERFQTVATKDEVTIDPVPQFRVIPTGVRTIGYVEFRTFISTSNADLLTAFADFTAQGVTDVIIDLRYNGGGLVSVAEFTASLLAGPSNVNNVLSTSHFNQANSDMNETSRFTSESNSIDLDAIVFIATGASASASELVINSLEPYIDVALIGSDTFGKPVGQVANDFCGQRLRAVAFETVNANGEGQYFDGLPVDCPAEDDLSHAIGDSNEASTAAALTYIATGACPTVQNADGRTAGVLSTDRARRKQASRPAGPIWRELAGAY